MKTDEQQVFHIWINGPMATPELIAYAKKERAAIRNAQYAGAAPEKCGRIAGTFPKGWADQFKALGIQVVELPKSIKHLSTTDARIAEAKAKADKVPDAL